MQELTDDQLDGLFRKSAEEFDPPFDPAAWQAMQTRLDEHNRTAAGPVPLRNRLIRWGLPLLLLLLLTGGGWYASQSVQTSGRNNVPSLPNRAAATPPTTAQSKLADLPATREVSTKAPDNATKAPLSGVLAKRMTSTTPVQKPASEAKVTNEGLVATSTKRPTPVRAGVRSPTDPTVQAAFGNEAVPVSAGGRKESKRSRRVGVGQQTEQRRIVSRNTGIEKAEPLMKRPLTTPNPDWTPPALGSVPTTESTAQPGIVASNALVTVSALAIRPGQWPKPLGFTTRPVVARPDTAAQRQPVVKPLQERGMSVRFVVSPDLSTVGLKNFARPGTNVGLMLEYRLARRWSIQAGALWSTKVYNANEVPAYTSYWSVKPEGVSGRCSLFDIPINLRYDFALPTRPDGQTQTRWFVSGGATTYIMQQEDYDYKYANPDDPHIYPNRRGWHGTTGRYNFSQLNLSVGYEQTLSRRLSWQAEPFMKVPLQGVGYYKINLLSTGAFLSLRYKL